MIAIVGPTAVGKSELALTLAKKYHGEIIALDSMQIYRGLDIGTAKPTLKEQQAVPHHLFDLVEPWEPFDLAQYQELALATIAEIHSRGKIPFLVGGTGLYLRAVLYDFLFSEESSDPKLRAELESQETEVLYQELQKVDPETAARLHPNDRRRIVRGVEVYLVTGEPISARQAQTTKRERFGSLIFCLTRKRSELYQRINLRVDKMLELGLLAEAEELYKLDQTMETTARQAIGYKEFFPYFRGEYSYEEAVRILKRNTRRYAKRQLTWFRKEDPIWIDLTEGEEQAKGRMERAIETTFDLRGRRS